MDQLPSDFFELPFGDFLSTQVITNGGVRPLKKDVMAIAIIMFSFNGEINQQSRILFDVPILIIAPSPVSNGNLMNVSLVHF